MNLGKASVDGSLRVFPSLHPNRRFEVKQLDSTFEAMMDELGIRKSSKSPEMFQILNLEHKNFRILYYRLGRMMNRPVLIIGLKMFF